MPSVVEESRYESFEVTRQDPSQPSHKAGDFAQGDLSGLS
jgi:hypothetical protein